MMCVIESRPVILDGDIVTEFGCTAANFRQSCLNSKSGAAEPRPMEHVNLSDDLGVLSREFRARVINVSGSGC